MAHLLYVLIFGHLGHQEAPFVDRFLLSFMSLIRVASPFGQSSGASRWKVCYQRGLTPSSFFSYWLFRNMLAYILVFILDCGCFRSEQELLGQKLSVQQNIVPL